MMDGYIPFEKLESHVLEVKDLSRAKDVADWKQLYITVSAFLNTDGGLVLCGIKENEKEKNYEITGFNSEHEDKIRAELTSGNHFTDDERNALKLDHRNITFKLFNFRGKQIGVVNVHPFADDEKFVFYRKTNTAYIREMTGDKKLTQAQLEAHQEYKRELEYARELRPVPDATIEDLDLGKIQQLVRLLNESGPFLSVPESMEEAMPFLDSNYFIQNNQVTLLGMLTCGRDAFYHLDKRAEVDCFLDTTNKAFVTADRRYFKGTITHLMDDSVQFVARNIKVATSYEGNGKAVPEYPLDLLRECINNAIAHRDYKSNRPVQVIIQPDQKIVIKNPGTFKQKMLIEIPDDDQTIYRIAPPKGLPESKNPKLANFLKEIQFIENRGVGMATLVGEALEHRIGMPYYTMDADTVILNIPTGNILDFKTKAILQIYDRFITNKLTKKMNRESAETILAYLIKAEDIDAYERATILLTKENNHLKTIKDLVRVKLIEEHPNSPKHHPIYRVHRQLRKTEYYDELEEIFGANQFKALSDKEQQMLNAVYINQHFGRTYNLGDEEENKAQFWETITSFLIFDTYEYQTDVKNPVFFQDNFLTVNELLNNKKLIIFSEEQGYQINDSK